MAAAALSRSRGVAGVRPKGLFSIFTLLCLVCLSSSLTHKDQLTELKETLQKIQNGLDAAKAEMGTAVHLAGKSLSDMESLEAFMETEEEEFDDYPHLQEVVQGVKGFVKRAKNTVDEMDVEMRAQIKNIEQELERQKKFVNFLAEL